MFIHMATYGMPEIKVFLYNMGAYGVNILVFIGFGLLFYMAHKRKHYYALLFFVLISYYTFWSVLFLAPYIV